MSFHKSYAKALLGIAQDQKLSAADLDQMEKELGVFEKTLEDNASLRQVLENPTVSARDKAEIAAQIAAKSGFSKLTAQFMEIVARKSRISDFTGIVEAFASARLESEGATLGSVVSADALQPSDLEELSKSFTRKLGKKVVFKAKIDPTLLAGIQVTVSGVTYDGSLRSQLQQLRDRLVFGNAGAVH